MWITTLQVCCVDIHRGYPPRKFPPYTRVEGVGGPSTDWLVILSVAAQQRHRWPVGQEPSPSACRSPHRVSSRSVACRRQIQDSVGHKVKRRTSLPVSTSARKGRMVFTVGRILSRLPLARPESGPKHQSRTVNRSTRGQFLQNPLCRAAMCSGKAEVSYIVSSTRREIEDLSKRLYPPELTSVMA